MSEDIKIRLLEFPTCIRERSGMYVGGVDDASVLFREVIDNAFDESYSWKGCNEIVVDQDWVGYHLVMDNGRGIPITLSPDRPGETMACVAVSSLHSGSKFDSTDTARNGMNGCGESAVNALSESFILMSKVTEHNYNKSIPIVREVYEKTGRNTRKELYYIIVFERGIKVFEGCDRLCELEKKIANTTGHQTYTELPRGFSTIALFRPDPEIFDKVTSKVPIKNLQYFLLIQEKFYKKKVNITVNGQSFREIFKPYQFELLKTIVPADTSKNKTVSTYITFEVDPELGNSILDGSVSGLDVEGGIHIKYATSCFETALKNEYRISHKYTLTGLKLCVIILAGDVIFDSQTKTRLKSITKVKQTDFSDIVKEFGKIIRANKEYWDVHVDKLNILAESMKSISASDKARKIVESSNGNSFYRSKLELVDGFAEATASNSERMNCELFLCEGLSPAGSLKSGRKDTKYHAIMPLRGKVLNVSDKTAEQMLDNKELYTIFKAVGLGLDVYNVTEGCSTVEEAMTKLKKSARYGKICIACFTGDTKIKLFGSNKPEITFEELVENERLQPGTKFHVLSSLEDGTIVPGVAHSPRITRYTKQLLSVEFDHGFVVKCTPDHLFMLSSGDYKEAQYLTSHDKLMHGNTKRSIKSVNFIELDTEIPVYDITVDDYHNFALSLGEGSRDITFVHNCDADSDGLQIQNALLYTFSKFARFLIEFGMVYISESPLFYQDGKYYYPSDPTQPDSIFPIGLNPNKPFKRYKGLGSLNKSDIYDAFYNPNTRRLIQVTPEGIDYSMSLVEDITQRKKLLYDNGILSNPYNFTDI